MEALLKQVLESLRTYGLGDITPHDIEGLLVGDPNTLSETVTLNEDCPGSESKITQCAEVETGYPRSPLYLHLAHRLQSWMSSRSLEVVALQEFQCLNEGERASERKNLFAALSGDIGTLQDLLTENNLAASTDMLILILKKLKKRGILSLLGLRNTEGSVEMLPPARSSLEKSFKQQNSANSQLSVGARALAKHCHRDQTASWWGKSTGSEGAKNDHANAIMNCILDQASWINIHCLPHSVVTLEIRCLEGYGARWTADGTSFRGFLEPQMEDGHSVGWKH
ncbi:uncharacterized protein [Antedon mediterranea]|uniref:uncharacterized protein n=1 Tax=Antedon mediterranea TaxID=105859 RepID=UPI003AF9C7CC